jgi:hypothetical protein
MGFASQSGSEEKVGSKGASGTGAGCGRGSRSKFCQRYTNISGESTNHVVPRRASLPVALHEVQLSQRF